MEKKNSLRPVSGHAITDLEADIMAVILNLDIDMGGLENADEAVFRMFQLAMPQATHQEIHAFTTVQGAFRMLTALVRNSHHAFIDMLAEHQSYLKKRDDD